MNIFRFRQLADMHAVSQRQMRQQTERNWPPKLEDMSRGNLRPLDNCWS